MATEFPDSEWFYIVHFPSVVHLQLPPSTVGKTDSFGNFPPKIIINIQVTPTNLNGGRFLESKDASQISKRGIYGASSIYSEGNDAPKKFGMNYFDKTW